jgi:hypothetical protein
VAAVAKTAEVAAVNSNLAMDPRMFFFMLCFLALQLIMRGKAGIPVKENFGEEE